MTRCFFLFLPMFLSLVSPASAWFIDEFILPSRSSAEETLVGRDSSADVVEIVDFGKESMVTPSVSEGIAGTDSVPAQLPGPAVIDEVLNANAVSTIAEPKSVENVTGAVNARHEQASANSAVLRGLSELGGVVSATGTDDPDEKLDEEPPTVMENVAAVNGVVPESQEPTSVETEAELETNMPTEQERGAVGAVAESENILAMGSDTTHEENSEITAAGDVTISAPPMPELDAVTQAEDVDSVPRVPDVLSPDAPVVNSPNDIVQEASVLPVGPPGTSDAIAFESASQPTTTGTLPVSNDSGSNETLDVQAILSDQTGSSAQQLAIKSAAEGFVNPLTGMQFDFVRGGCFMMGSRDCNGSTDCSPEDEFAHEVCLDDFWIGRYEVTQAQWQKVTGTNPSHFEGDTRPVERVSWHDVREFLAMLNRIDDRDYRLPTEAEWEYAARSGGRDEEWAGAEVDKTPGSYAWYTENSGEMSHPVGQKQPNGLGLYDMSGNVREWCSDRFDNDYYRQSSRDNPQGPDKGLYRVQRGGSWLDTPDNLRVRARNWNNPDDRSNFLGLRLVLPVDNKAGKQGGE